MNKFPDNLPCGYFSFSPDNIITDINDTLLNLLGLVRDEVLFKKTDIILTVPSRIFWQTHFYPLLKMNQHAGEIFLTLLCKNGDSLPVLLNASFYHESYSCICITVYNRKKFEDELIHAKKAAESALNENSALIELSTKLRSQAQILDSQLTRINKQNEELLEFNHAVTHELQEPLRKISVFSQMLVRVCNDQPEVENAQSRLQRSLKQMQEIVSGLQKYLWLEDHPVNLNHNSLNDIIRDAELLFRKMQGDVPFIINTHKLPDIIADAALMSTLFLELYMNSFRFSKPGIITELNISAVEIKRNSYQFVNSHYNYEDYWKIDIRDNGIGFEPDYNEVIFSLFKRAHQNSGKGTGLTICRKIMEKHKGFISAMGKPGEGVVITLLLPVTKI